MRLIPLATIVCWLITSVVAARLALNADSQAIQLLWLLVVWIGGINGGAWSVLFIFRPRVEDRRHQANMEFLLAQIKTVKGFLVDTPAENVIERMTWEARLENLREKLEREVIK